MSSIVKYKSEDEEEERKKRPRLDILWKRFRAQMSIRQPISLVCFIYRPAASSDRSDSPSGDIPEKMLWCACAPKLYSVCGRRIGKGIRIACGGGYVRLLVLGVGEDALGLESSPGLLKSPCLNAVPSKSASSLCFRQRRDKPGVGLVCVADDAEGQTAKEAPVEDVLPALLLVLLARLDAEEDTARGVVVVVV
jgi:hypothetical protein